MNMKHFLTQIITSLSLSICVASYAQTNGHSYVDLGLPSGNLWSTCNLGASSPYGYGDYYAWGELSPKNRYEWKSYRFSDSSGNITKYREKDHLGVLEPDDDVAHVQWGGNWQIPSYDDWRELLDNVKVYYESSNGKYFTFQSKINGRQMIIPLNGYKNSKGTQSTGLAMCLWLASVSTRLFDEEPMFSAFVKEGNAYMVVAESSSNNMINLVPGEAPRSVGAAIRPVCPKQPKLSKDQLFDKIKKDEEEKERLHREEEADQPISFIMTTHKPSYPGSDSFATSVKDFGEFIKDKIGRDLTYSFVGQVYVGKDGRVYDANIYKKNSGPDNLEYLFRNAALSSPTWTPAKDSAGEHLVKCVVTVKVGTIAK